MIEDRSHSKHKDIIDTRHDFPLLPDPFAAEASRYASRQILEQNLPPDFRDPVLYSKHQPEILREQAIHGLFSSFFTPGRQVATILQPRKEEIIVAPDSDGFLYEAAFGTLESSGETNVIVAAEGFDERMHEYAGVHGLWIDPVPAIAPDSFKPDPDMLAEMLQKHGNKGNLRGALITQPNKAGGETYTLPELQTLGEILVDANTPIIGDIGGSQLNYKSTFTPLAALTVRSSSGRLVPLYDRMLTVTDTEKAYGKLGIAGFGAACTGNTMWRRRIIANLATPFQRETTHKARQILEHTSEEFLQYNRNLMRSGQKDARRHVERLQKEFGNRSIRMISNHMGMRAALLFDPTLLYAAGIGRSGELATLLEDEANIFAVPLHLMGIARPGISANIVTPLLQGPDGIKLIESEQHRKKIRAELFDRIGKVMAAIQ